MMKASCDISDSLLVVVIFPTMRVMVLANVHGRKFQQQLSAMLNMLVRFPIGES